MEGASIGGVIGDMPLAVAPVSCEHVSCVSMACDVSIGTAAIARWGKAPSVEGFWWGASPSSSLATALSQLFFGQLLQRLPSASVSGPSTLGVSSASID